MCQAISHKHSPVNTTSTSQHWEYATCTWVDVLEWWSSATGKFIMDGLLWFFIYCDSTLVDGLLWLNAYGRFIVIQHLWTVYFDSTCVWTVSSLFIALSVNELIYYGCFLVIIYCDTSTQCYSYQIGYYHWMNYQGSWILI